MDIRYQFIFQMKCTDSDIPPSVRWSAHRYQISIHIFRWSVQIQIYPPQFRWGEHKHQIWVHIFRWCIQIQIYPCQIPHRPQNTNHSENMFQHRDSTSINKNIHISDGQPISRHMGNLWEPIRNVHCSSLLLKFQVYCSTLLLKFTPPIWNCHAQQNMYWPIYVCSENPFETVIFITALFIKALHCVIWCWAIGEVSHTFITYKNEGIYVNFKFLLCLWFHVVVCAELHKDNNNKQNNNNKKNENKKIHVNWSFCSDWSFIEKTSVKQE